MPPFVLKRTSLLLTLFTCVAIFLAGCGSSNHDELNAEPTYAVSINIPDNLEAVTFQLNDAETLTAPVAGRYQFTTRLPENTPVKIAVIRQPAHQTCFDPDGIQNVMNDEDLEFLFRCNDYHRGLTNATEIAIGDHHSCAIDHGQVTCWGSNDNHLIDAPTNLINPRQLGAGEYHSCVLDDNGVHCWGLIEELSPTPTSLDQPEKLFVYDEAVCIINSAGRPTCWGYLQPEYLDLIGSFSGISEIGVGDNNVCTHANDTLTCWKIYPKTEITLQRTISSSTKLYFGRLQNCMISSFTVECWDNNNQYDSWDDLSITPPQSLSNPVAISLDFVSSCLIDEGQIKCWPGIGWPAPVTIDNAQKISHNLLHSCAIDNQGVICWGGDSDGQSQVPEAIF